MYYKRWFFRTLDIITNSEQKGTNYGTNIHAVLVPSTERKNTNAKTMNLNIDMNTAELHNEGYNAVLKSNKIFSDIPKVHKMNQCKGIIIYNMKCL